MPLHALEYHNSMQPCSCCLRLLFLSKTMAATVLVQHQTTATPGTHAAVYSVRSADTSMYAVCWATLLTPRCWQCPEQPCSLQVKLDDWLGLHTQQQHRA